MDDQRSKFAGASRIAKAMFYELAPWTCAGVGVSLYVICILIDPSGEGSAWLWIPFWLAVIVLCLGTAVGGLGWLEMGESRIGTMVMCGRMAHAFVLFLMLVVAVNNEELWRNAYFNAPWEIALWGFALTPGASALALVVRRYLASATFR